jgi:hypothetical protein
MACRVHWLSHADVGADPNWIEIVTLPVGRATPSWTMRMTDYPPGLTCELAEARLEQYLAGALAWAEALAVAEHLEACPSCEQRLVLLRLEIGVARVWSSGGPIPNTLRGAEGEVGERHRGGRRRGGGRHG